MTTETDATVAELEALDLSIDALASKGNFAALEALLSDEFIYSHSTGLSQDKATWVASLGPLLGRRQRVPSSVRVELHGDVAVTNADLDIVWNDAPTKYNRYVRVWRREGGTWRAISQRTVPGEDRHP
jgi:hypothetical protein